MQAKFTLTLVILITILFSGCSIKQNVQAVDSLEDKEVCIIKNSKVLYDFLGSYRNALLSKNYEVKILDDYSDIDSCPTTSTYTANWRWDLAMYMAYANITVYEKGKLKGEATYDAISGSANMNKFIKADEKIRELTNQLYPNQLQK